MNDEPEYAEVDYTKPDDQWEVKAVVGGWQLRYCDEFVRKIFDTRDQALDYLASFLMGWGHLSYLDQLENLKAAIRAHMFVPSPDSWAKVAEAMYWAEDALRLLRASEDEFLSGKQA